MDSRVALSFERVLYVWLLYACVCAGVDGSRALSCPYVRVCFLACMCMRACACAYTCLRVVTAACVGVFVGVRCDCLLTDRRAAPVCRPRVQGWLGARRLTDTGNNRAVARGHRWCAGAGAVGGGARCVGCYAACARCCGLTRMLPSAIDMCDVFGANS